MTSPLASLQDVSVNVVGKYRSRMPSPADDTWLPVIIDIILVGRTKIITLHSGIWVENGIERQVGGPWGPSVGCYLYCQASLVRLGILGGTSALVGGMWGCIPSYCTALFWPCLRRSRCWV